VFVCLYISEYSLSGLGNWIYFLLNDNDFTFFFWWLILNDVNNYSLFGFWVHFKYNSSFFWCWCFYLRLILFYEVSYWLLHFYNLSNITFNYWTCFIDLFNSFYNLSLLTDLDCFINNFLGLGRNIWFRELLDIQNFNYFLSLRVISKLNLFDFLILINRHNSELFLLYWSSNAFNLFSFEINNLGGLRYDSSNCRNYFLYLLNLIWSYNFITFFSNFFLQEYGFSFLFLNQGSWCYLLCLSCLHISDYSVTDILVADLCNSFLTYSLYHYFLWLSLFDLWVISFNLFDCLLEVIIFFDNFLV